MYLLLVFLPLFSFLGASAFGRYLGPKGASVFTVTCLGVSALLAGGIFYEVGLQGSPVYLVIGPWMSAGTFTVNWGFLFDTLTAVMCCVVTWVSSLVHLYSTEYMKNDPHLPRFMSYLSFFTFFMLILVTADNYLQMFVGWEGVGLCSFLLINFWFTRIQANKAAIKAMVMNRIGDFGLALGILMIFAQYQSTDYTSVFAATPAYVGATFSFCNCEVDLLTTIGLLLFVGSVGKSAQLGLHTWLPDAMEGPTPVSALIHAATMVTAGVFLLARSSPLLEHAPAALEVVTVLGAMTAFFAATTGLLQNDLKKVIAYSTCSQLGYMVFACGLSNYGAGVFHLVNHAFFKALLFLGAGAVIHAIADEQDMRKMGGIRRLVPFTYSVMTIGSLALMGFPFLSGFYSKDVILEVAYGHYSAAGHFAYTLGSLAAFVTAFYSFRLAHLTFLSDPNGYRPVLTHAHDPPLRMAVPLIVLAFPSVLIGYCARDMFIGMGTDFWGNSLYVLPEHMNAVDSEFIPHFYKVLPVCLSLSGAASAFALYSGGTRLLYARKVSAAGRTLYTFLNKKWFFDKVYTELVGQSALFFGYHVSYKIVDRGVIEVLGPMGLSKSVRQLASQTSALQTGFLYHYALAMVLGLGTLVVVTQSY